MTFGGPDLRTLYITTAWASLTQEQFWNQPLAGAILSVRVDVPGVPEPEFGAGEAATSARGVRSATA